MLGSGLPEGTMAENQAMIESDHRCESYPDYIGTLWFGIKILHNPRGPESSSSFSLIVFL